MLLFLDSLIYKHKEIKDIIKSSYNFSIDIEIIKGDRYLGTFKFLNKDNINYYRILNNKVGVSHDNVWGFDE